MSFFGGSDAGLQRLKITGYKNIQCTDPTGADFTVQVNPAEMKYVYAVKGMEDKDKGGATDKTLSASVGESGPPAAFKGYESMDMVFKFKADATGVLPIAKDMEGEFGGDKSPSIRVHLQKLQETVYAYQTDTHAPPFLKFVWGKIFPNTSNGPEKTAVFKGKMKKCEITVKLFALDGEPIKADIVLTVESVIAADAKLIGNSPDVSHFIPINFGDKMTTICKNIYGRYDSKICAAVANYNGLINCDLQGQVGEKLTFPSIQILEESYIEDWDTIEEKKKKISLEKIETHYEHMESLIGKKKAKQYFKTFGFAPDQPYEQWQEQRNKNKGYA